MHSATVSLSVRVIPNASCNTVVGWVEGKKLKIKVQTPAEGGRANEAVMACLAKALNLPIRAITLKTGEKSREKQLLIIGLSLKAIEKALNQKE